MNNSEDINQEDPVIKALDEYKAESHSLDVFQVGELTRRHQELYGDQIQAENAVFGISRLYATGLAAMGLIAIAIWLGVSQVSSPLQDEVYEDEWIPLSAFYMNFESEEDSAREPFADLQARIQNYRLAEEQSGHRFLMNYNESLNARMDAIKINMLSNETL